MKILRRSLASVVCNLFLWLALAAPAQPFSGTFELEILDRSIAQPWLKTVGDLNGDNRTDIVVGGAKTGGLVAHLNQFPTWERRVIDPERRFGTDGEVADLDGDGRVDLLVITLGPDTVTWYRQRESGWEREVLTTQTWHDLEVADFDGDGHPDIVGRNQREWPAGDDAGNRLHFLWQKRGTNSVLWEESTLECAPGEGLLAADLDRDGDQDIVINGRWYENLGQRRWQEHTFVKTEDWSHPNTYVACADFNGDERLDVVMAPSELKGSHYRIAWFEAPADPRQQGWEAHVIVPQVETVCHFVGAADFDRDGRADIAYAHMPQGADPDYVKVLFNRGRLENGRWADAWEAFILSEAGSHSMRILDADGDGRPDLLGANWSAEGRDEHVKLWLNRPPRHSGALLTFPHEFAALTNVVVQDEFWTPLLERNRTVTIPHQLKMLEADGSLRNFDRAAGKLAGDPEPIWMSDEVVYKWVEAASYELARRPDAKLAEQVNSVISRIGAAQEPDGYLYTHRTIAMRSGKPSPGRWADMNDNELYCGGHLYEAAVAYFEATGQRSLLDVAIRNADLVERTFGIGAGKRRDVCGHPNNEQALVKLARATGDRRYLRLADYFVDERGRANGRNLYGSFAQDHQPLIDQEEAVGQAPRATYLYSAAADLAALLGRDEYRRATERLWQNVVGTKLYITGGIGSKHDNEGFGPPYDLPNLSAYTEICAGVSFPMWAERMFQLTGDGKYLDVFERTVYNNLLAGVSLTGDRYFYACPAESDGQFKFNVGWMPKEYRGPHREAVATRKEWFACACCPPNYSRWVAQLPRFIYAHRGPEIFVNLYVASTARIPIGTNTVELVQSTLYPRESSINLTVNSTGSFALNFRVPGWSRGQPVPSDLYRYVSSSSHAPTLRLNGRVVPLVLTNGFARIDREWQPGDLVQLELPMPVKLVAAHPQVTANANRVALERGPLVYSVEGADHDGRVLDLKVLLDGRFEVEFRPNLLGGSTVLRGTAQRVVNGKQTTVPLTAVPYYLWSNRGAGEMAVWLPLAER
jgi:uncharacterized protein